MEEKNVNYIVHVSKLIRSYSQFSLEVCNWIGCQFALESDFGKSNLAKDNNNHCGMRNPLVRISTACHAGDTFYHWAQYDDIESCVVDYLLLLQYYRPISTNYDTPEHLSAFISKFYCPSKDYISKINLIYQQFKSYQNGKD